MKLGINWFNTEVSSQSEQDIINGAEEILRDRGTVERQFITKSMNPQSTELTPDLIFTPESGPNQGVPHVVEFQKTNKRFLPSVVVANSSRNSRRIQDLNAEQTIRFALSSNGIVDLSKRSGANIEAMGKVEDSTALADQIIRWSDSV